MNCIETTEPQTEFIAPENTVHLPLGLLGFEKVKKFVLLANPDEAPFAWLQMLSTPGFAFLVVPASDVLPIYAPDISPDDVSFLGLTEPSDAILYNIVTLRGDDEATVNLKGPVVMNRFTMVAKQVIPLNAAEYTSQHPLTLAE